MLMTCPNISIAARQIIQLIDQCKLTPRFAAHPIRCAIAAYHASWDHPDKKFADAVLRSVATGDAPNFEMPDDIGDRSDDVAAKRPVAGEPISTARSVAVGDQLQAWSSALFPARSKQLDGTNSSGADADRLQESSTMTARPVAAPSHDNGLFVRRLPERRPQ
jgi:hypothetical protein